MDGKKSIINISALAKKLDVTPRYIHYIKSGRSGKQDTAKQRLVKKALGITD